MLFLATLGPRLSIGITIMVTPFIDVLATQLLLLLLKEFSLMPLVACAMTPRAMGLGLSL
jgi:hypothetical protein